MADWHGHRENVTVPRTGGDPGRRQADRRSGTANQGGSTRCRTLWMTLIDSQIDDCAERREG